MHKLLFSIIILCANTNISIAQSSEQIKQELVDKVESLTFARFENIMLIMKVLSSDKVPIKTKNELYDFFKIAYEGYVDFITSIDYLTPKKFTPEINEKLKYAIITKSTDDIMKIEKESLLKEHVEIIYRKYLDE